MKQQNSQTHLVIEHNKNLFVYDLESLKLTNTINTKVSSFTLNNQNLVFGDLQGNLFHTDIDEENLTINKIYAFDSKIDSLFLNDAILCASTEEGDAFVFIAKFPKIQKINKIQHSAPIKKLICDGNTVYINDIRNRLTIFPKQKVFDNIEQIYFKEYLFAVEKNNLFCKTESAFSTVFINDEEIEKILFSRTGSVIFIQSSTKIAVLDLNDKILIKEIKPYNQKYNRVVDSDESEDFCLHDFVFDELRNRILFIKEDKVLKAILEATTSIGERFLQKKLKKIELEDVQFEEKFVFEKEEEKVNRIGNKRATKVLKYEFVDEKNDENLDSYNLNHRNDKLENLFDSQEIEISESSEESAVKIEELVHKMMPVFENEKLALLTYNNTGYLTTLYHETYNSIILNYHDSSIPSLNLRDENKCHLGSFFDKKIVLCNSQKMYFYSENIYWEKETENAELIGITEYFICYTTGTTLTVVDFDKEELFCCEFKEIKGLFCAQNQILIAEPNYISLIDTQNNFLRTKFDIVNNVVWFNTFNNDIFYSVYQNNSYIVHQIISNNSVRVSDCKGIPLCIINNHIVSLSRMDIEPFVEYNEIKCKKPGMIKNKERVVVEEEKEEVEFKKEVTFKTKKFFGAKK